MKFILNFQRTALHIAVEIGSIIIVKKLLNHKKIDLNIKNENVFYI